MTLPSFLAATAAAATGAAETRLKFVNPARRIGF